MKKLRFKNRNGILYFGIGEKFKSSKLKDTVINRNIIVGKFKSGQLDKELGFKIIVDIPTIVNLLTEVMQSKSKMLKYKTLVTYKSSCKNSIIPYFKDTLVTEVKPITIKKFQDFLMAKNLGKQSLVHARVLLKEVFSIAILNEWITLNPIMMVDIPRFKEDKENKKQKQKPFTLDEIDLILNNTNKVYKNFFGISFFTGMRSGEILALKWEDIDFSSETISINKNVSNGFIDTPKTYSSIRDIEMLDKAKEFLKSQQLLTGLKNSYIFLNSKNKHYFSNTFFYIEFQKTLERVGIDKRALHNTRHTFASMMLNNKIEPLWVSHTLGHENLQITLDTYTHYIPKKEKMSIDFLEKRYKNGTRHE